MEAWPDKIMSVPRGPQQVQRGPARYPGRRPPRVEPQLRQLVPARESEALYGQRLSSGARRLRQTSSMQKRAGCCAGARQLHPRQAGSGPPMASAQPRSAKDPPSQFPAVQYTTLTQGTDFRAMRRAHFVRRVLALTS